MFAKGFFRNKKKTRIKQGNLIVSNGGLDELPIELINSIRIQNGLSSLRERGVTSEEFKKLPKGSRLLSKDETDKLLFDEPNLLEIKLKDTDSVPEVYYKGERLDEYPKGLIDISYHWKTAGITNEEQGANDINIEYYSSPNDKYLDKKTIGHKREV